MAQIFVSHSRNDRDLVNYFAIVSSGTKVKLVFEEFENLVSGKVKASDIRKHISASNAVFVLLSPHVEMKLHTRDWISSESGYAGNKDVWVFECSRDIGRVTVIIPFLRHYVVYEPNDAYLPYMRKVVETYDDSHVIPTVLVTAGLAALLGGLEGVAAATLVGIPMLDKSSVRPKGQEITCAKCSSSYSVHLPKGTRRFRCPVCNAALALA
jgi:hypothetical protein